jgi:arylsulfatase
MAGSGKVKPGAIDPMKHIFCILSCTALACSASAADRPNILLILADDLGYSDLGCYGGEIDTPNIDALASCGVRFTQLYNSARCCPSRASLMTGLYPSQAGIGDFTTSQPSPTRGPGYLGRLNDRCVTLAEVLKPAGYGCYYVGKWHMHTETGPIRRGFDEFYGYTRGHSHDQYDADYYIRLPEGRKKEIDPPADDFYATDVFNEYALEFTRQGQQSGKPWFLFLGHSSPHFPVQAPAERADKYEARYLRGWDTLREERFRRMQKLGLIDGEHWKLPPRSIVPVDRDEIANGFPGQPNPAWDALDEERRRDLARRMAVFAAMVESVDRGVGRIVAHLESTGDLDNTLILFLSDNGACYEWGPFGFDGTSRRGETILYTGDDLRKIGGPGTHQSYGSGWANLGNTPLRLYKHFTHEGGISTPFIAHWPQGIGSPNQWIRDPAHVMDMMPTILEAIGGSYPEMHNGNAITPLEGMSLLPAMRGKSLPERTIGFDHQGAHALRQGDWKLVWSKRMPYEIEWELYNLAKDRCETNDLAKTHPERVETMVAEWEQWARRVDVAFESKEVAQQPDSPRIAHRPLTISGTVKWEQGAGVIVAQGGREHGYAVHLLDGKLAFDVRVNGKVTRIVSEEPAPKAFDFEAKLTAKSMALAVNGEPVAEAHSPGLIPVQPKDPMNIGHDELTAAGDYEPPNRLQGAVRNLRVMLGWKCLTDNGLSR